MIFYVLSGHENHVISSDGAMYLLVCGINTRIAAATNRGSLIAKDNELSEW